VKLEFIDVTARNFKSFGDYDTTFPLANQGPILIKGVNGAGKSTMPGEIIIWALFGRLSNVPSPADSVINWETGHSCMVHLRMADGYEIVRTRKMDRHSDLLILKDGEPVPDGDSTNADAQKTLNRLFDLDFNTFISSFYFGQSSESYLSLSSAKQKKVIEKVFGISGLRFYAEAAKSKLADVESAQTTVVREIKANEDVLIAKRSQRDELEQRRKDAERLKTDKITELSKELKAVRGKKHKPINIEVLESQWATINEAEEKIKVLDAQLKAIDDDMRSQSTKKLEFKGARLAADSLRHKVDVDKTALERDIRRWDKMRDTECPTCEQPVRKGQVDKKIQQLRKAIEPGMKKLEAESQQLNARLDLMDSNIERVDKLIATLSKKRDKLAITIGELRTVLDQAKRGKQTISEAKSHNLLISQQQETINRISGLIEEEKSREDPYAKMISQIEKAITTAMHKAADLEQNQSQLDSLASHLMYIHKAYSDKRRIRAYVIAGYLSVLNDRLTYYYNALGIDTDMKFNEMLQFKSDKWPYNLHSGGERKRFDLAVMCALNDTFVAMHGQQSNVQILDEIDKDLDNDGVDQYVKLIIDDLAHRIETIVVISHKDEINFAFPSQIMMTKQDNCSHM